MKVGNLSIIIGYVLQFVMIIEAAIRALAYNDESVPVGAIVFLIYSLAVVIPSLAVNVRRLHDIGKSGWYYFIWLIPPFIVGAIILFVWYCKDSQPGENKYGANPKECLEQQQWN